MYISICIYRYIHTYRGHMGIKLQYMYSQNRATTGAVMFSCPFF